MSSDRTDTTQNRRPVLSLSVLPEHNGEDLAERLENLQDPRQHKAAELSIAESTGTGH
jgi:hypothetical protein